MFDLSAGLFPSVQKSLVGARSEVSGAYMGSRCDVKVCHKVQG